MSMFTITRTTKALTAIATAAFLSMTAGAAQSQYVGGGYLSDYRGCDEAGWPTSIEMFRARYNPSEIQGRFSSLVLDLAVGGTMTYSVRGALEPSRRWYRALGHAVWGALYESTPRPRLRVVERNDSMTGGATVPAHDQLRMTVRIRNFNGRRGCIVTARMMLRDMTSTRAVR